MLQPRHYPKLIGQALMLEAEPFIRMTDDDNPWAEGVFFTLCIGLAIGVAQLVGGWLTTAILPPPQSLVETLLQLWRQLQTLLQFEGSQLGAETWLRSGLAIAIQALGYTSGWSRLFVLVTAPAALLTQWLVYGLLGHFVARRLGGTGTINQTLGAFALMAAPYTLYLFSVIPFVSAGGLLLTVWSMLIAYRALAIAHDLLWRRALFATVVIGGVVVAAGSVLLLLLLVIVGW